MVAKRGYHHGDLRNALLSEAIEIILESGTGALSLRRLAGRVGVSPAAYAYHFPDKSSLLIAIGTEGFRRLNAAFAPAPTVADLMLQRDDDRTAWESALMIWAQIHGAASLWLEGLLAPGATEGEAIEQLRSLVYRGLSVAAAGRNEQKLLVA